MRELHDTTSIVRIRAMNQIAERSDRGEREALAIVRVALEDPDPEVCRSAQWSLRHFGAQQAVIVDRLAAATASSDTLLRANGVAALGEMAAHSERALPLVLGLGDDPTPTVRAGVNRGLGDVDLLWPGQLPMLVDFFAKCDPKVRFQVGTVFVLAGVDAVPPMLQNLESLDWNRRANAAHVLGRIGETDGRVTAALTARLADPDFRVRQHALRALGQVGTPAAHAAFVDHTGEETHGPLRKSLRLGNGILKPETTVVAVVGTYREARPGLEKFESQHLPDVVIAEEHRVYLCDVERRTVRELARVPVPEALRSGFTMSVLGWQGDSIVLQLHGQPAYVPNRHRNKFRWLAVDSEGRLHELAAKPGRMKTTRGYRDTAQGRHFLSIGVRGETVDRHDEIGRGPDHGPEVQPRPRTTTTVFRVDPDRAELLPAAP